MNRADQHVRNGKTGITGRFVNYTFLNELRYGIVRDYILDYYVECYQIDFLSTDTMTMDCGGTFPNKYIYWKENDQYKIPYHANFDNDGLSSKFFTFNQDSSMVMTYSEPYNLRYSLCSTKPGDFRYSLEDYRTLDRSVFS